MGPGKRNYYRIGNRPHRRRRSKCRHHAHQCLHRPSQGYCFEQLGHLYFANVGIGHFNLNATASGFQKYTRTNIVVNTAQTLKENITLTVGSAAQTVTVAANALQVQSETSEVSTLISGQQVTQLATNGRNITSLAALGWASPTTCRPLAAVDALTSSNGISFNGTRPTHNIYLFDGGEQNDRGCGGCFRSCPRMTRSPSSRPSTATTVPITASAPAEPILMVLKSGTHDFHGEL